MDAIREKLREFYQKQYESALFIRKAASNYLLVEKLEGKKTILARFSIAGLGDLAEKVAAHARRCLCYEKSEDEMEKLTKDAPILPAFDPTKVTVAKLNIKDGTVTELGTVTMDKPSKLKEEEPAFEDAVWKQSTVTAKAVWHKDGIEVLDKPAQLSPTDPLFDKISSAS